MLFRETNNLPVGFAAYHLKLQKICGDKTPSEVKKVILDR